MTKRDRSIEKSTHWFEKPLSRYLTISGIITSIFLTGYKVGDYKNNLEQQLLLIKKEQECNQVVQQEKDKCAEYRREIETKQIESLQTTVEALSKIKGQGK